MSGRRFREQRGKIPIVLPYEFFLTPLNSCCGNNGWHVFPFLPRHPVGRSVPFALQRRTSPQRDMVRGIRLPDGCGLSFRQSISSDLSRLPSLHDPSRSLRPHALVSGQSGFPRWIRSLAKRRHTIMICRENGGFFASLLPAPAKPASWPQTASLKNYIISIRNFYCFASVVFI